jgi:tetratricopeptide (TPR) repeat protein
MGVDALSSVPGRRTPAALIIGLALLAYWNSFSGGFQFDDFKVIVDNPAVVSLEAWWQSMPGIRPLLKLSYALNQTWGAVSGDALFGFHVVNLALHIGNALLLHGIARRLLADHPHAASIALLTALLFAVHPVNSEAVMLISGRSMSLMTLFYLASLLAYLDQRRMLSLAAFAAALATRETAITLPLALMLIEHLRAPTQSLSSSLKRTREYWLMATLAAATLLMLPWFRHLAAVSLATRPLVDNLISQSAAVLYLLKQAMWPFALDADPLLPVFTVWNPFWTLTSLLAIGLLGIALWLWRSSGPARWIGFGLLWFLLHLTPTNSLLPRLDLANERHLYLANIGLCLILAHALILALPNRPRLRGGLAAVILLALVWTTQARNPVYRNEVTFWQDIANKNPASNRAFNNLGHALANVGQPAQALAAYDQALRLKPDDFTARLNRAALCREHSTREPNAGGLGANENVARQGCPLPDRK